ncbi:DUF2225 domain-containing protein [Candidatus Riflebacteria bacterium]
MKKKRLSPDFTLVPKKITCPICRHDFKRHYPIASVDFPITRYDVDLRPVYPGNFHPRTFSNTTCPACFFSAKDTYFCAYVPPHQRAHKEILMSRILEANPRNRDIGDPDEKRLRTIDDEDVENITKIRPALTGVVRRLLGSIRKKPLNVLQQYGEGDLAIVTFSLAGLCYDARKLSNTHTAHAYLGAAWAARDQFDRLRSQEKKQKYKKMDMALSRIALTYFTRYLNSEEILVFDMDKAGDERHKSLMMKMEGYGPFMFKKLLELIYLTGAIQQLAKKYTEAKIPFSFLNGIVSPEVTDFGRDRNLEKNLESIKKYKQLANTRLGEIEAIEEKS